MPRLVPPRASLFPGERVTRAESPPLIIHPRVLLPRWVVTRGQKIVNENKIKVRSKQRKIGRWVPRLHNHPGKLPPRRACRPGKIPPGWHTTRGSHLPRRSASRLEIRKGTDVSPPGARPLVRKKLFFGISMQMRLTS